MTPEEIQAMIEQAITARLNNLNNLPFHIHNGIDAPKIKFQDLLPIPIVTTAPTDAAPEGTIRIYNSSGTIRLYVRANKTWKYKTIDNT